MNKFILIGVAALVSACSLLPSGGPSKSSINASERAGQINIVRLDSSVAKAVNVSNGYGFPSSFFQKGVASYERIRSGDTLSITIWENTDNGLFATLGNRVTPLAEMKVSQAGTIFVPYVGAVNVVGKTSEQVRNEITNKLSPQTPNPQVEVRVLSGFKGAVSISGALASSTVPFNEGNLTLASMLASAGIGSATPRSTRVSLIRGGQRGTILMQMLYDSSKYDVALRDGDKIVIESERREFTRWNETGGSMRVPFDRADLTLMDALSSTGGLDSLSANPSGVFVLRRMSTAQAQQLQRTGREYAQTTPYIAFVLDLRDPKNLFVADDFLLQDDDVVYVTNAAYANWTKVVSQVLGSVSSVSNVSTAVNSLSNLGKNSK